MSSVCPKTQVDRLGFLLIFDYLFLKCNQIFQFLIESLLELESRLQLFYVKFTHDLALLIKK